MFITNIKPGLKSIYEYRGKLLYAEVKENNDELICSATLEFILRIFYDRQNEVSNYKEALIKYLDFNNEVMKNI